MVVQTRDRRSLKALTRFFWFWVSGAVVQAPYYNTTHKGGGLSFRLILEVAVIAAIVSGEFASSPRKTLKSVHQQGQERRRTPGNVRMVGCRFTV